MFDTSFLNTEGRFGLNLKLSSREGMSRTLCSEALRLVWSVRNNLSASILSRKVAHNEYRSQGKTFSGQNKEFMAFRNKMVNSRHVGGNLKTREFRRESRLPWKDLSPNNDKHERKMSSSPYREVSPSRTSKLMTHLRLTLWTATT